MAQTYLFYDLETTGLNKCFDQVLQFAAIQTTLDFKEIDRYEYHIKLRPDVIPHPQALLTHRIGIDQLSKGWNEYEATQKIHALFNRPGTISLGYNSLSFDDEFLRFAFYRNLLPPYTHQYANQCYRMDVYPITLLYFLFKNSHLRWPEGNLKLENICACNDFLHTQAHNAMSDVEATLLLAKRLASSENAWVAATSYFHKLKDEGRLFDAPAKLMIDHHPYPYGFLVYGKIGMKDNYLAPVLYIGMHAHYKNQCLFLRLDTGELITETPKGTAKKAWVIKKRLAEPPFFLPFRDNHLSHLSEARKTLFQEHLNFIGKNPDYFYAIQQRFQREKYPAVPHQDIDAALYDIGFPTAAEEKLFTAFHQTLPENKLMVAENFSNPIRLEQAKRIMARHYPDYLEKKELAAFHDAIRSKKIVDYRGEEKLTPALALQEIQRLEASMSLDEQQKALLESLTSYLTATA